MMLRTKTMMNCMSICCMGMVCCVQTRHTTSHAA